MEFTFTPFQYVDCQTAMYNYHGRIRMKNIIINLKIKPAKLQSRMKRIRQHLPYLLHL